MMTVSFLRAVDLRRAIGVWPLSQIELSYALVASFKL